MTRYLKRQISDSIEMVRTCEHRSEKLMLALVSAILSAGALRMLASLGVALLPTDSWASGLAHQAMELSGLHFTLAVAIAALGGAASLFHELRDDMTRFTVQNALGHMLIAQFAGLLVFLLVVNYGQLVPLSLAACGLAGWGGGKVITIINDAVWRRLGRRLGITSNR